MVPKAKAMALLTRGAVAAVLKHMQLDTRNDFQQLCHGFSFFSEDFPLTNCRVDRRPPCSVRYASHEHEPEPVARHRNGRTNPLHLPSCIA